MADELHGREHLVRRQQAMLAVFKRFAGVWRVAFAANRWSDLIDTWLDAVAGIDTDALEPAAKAMLAAGSANYPPKPWEFAKFARQQQRDAGATAPAVHATRERGPLDGARAFWFERTQYDGTKVRAAAHALRTGGSVGIAETEMDKLLAGEIAWGWL